MLTPKKLKSLCLIGSLALTFSASSFAGQVQKPVANMGYVSLGNTVKGSRKINPIRLQALRETAIHLGATGALAWRSRQVDIALAQEATYLDHIFNFNQLLLNHDVLPPVLVESSNSLNLASYNSIRLASKTYKIISPARFVTAAPTWRTYLWMNFKKPALPNLTLLPRTNAEAKAWNAYIKEGWKEGLIQANEIFSVNLSRLKRAYSGMLLYRKLLAQHMVSAPYVAKADLGVVGNAHELRINDRVLRITAPSKLQTNSRDWRPIITQ